MIEIPMKETRIKEATKEDLDAVANLAVLLWNGRSIQEMEQEISELISKDHSRFFLICEQGTPVGFAQCQLRHDYVEGTETSPVGYLEGIYVMPTYRQKGYARELLAECEKWAKAQGCKEYASDCELDNEESYHFHRAMKFKEANRIICFTKEL